MENDRVVGVETPAGSVEASAVVVAAGAWSGELLAQIGFELPLVPVIATRFETAACGLPETLPTVQYHHGWLREYRGGFSWGDIDGYKVAAYSSRALLSGGRPVVRELIQSNRSAVGSVARIFPKLGAAETAKVWQGIPVYTPDRRFYAGAVEPIAGLFMLTGDNEAGVTHGPGLGRLVADLVRGLEPRFDPEPYRPSRHPKVSLAEATRLVTARFAGRIGR